MLRQTIELGHFLRSVAATDPLREYCERRGIPFEPQNERDAAALERWHDALASLPSVKQVDIELELFQVQELANRDSIYHLIDVCAERGLPSDLVAGEAAQALWFLVHHRDVFLEVYYNEVILERASWQNAETRPGIRVCDLASRQADFERELRRFFRVQEGTGRFIASQSHSFDDPACIAFIGFVSDRLRYVDGFTDGGEHRPQRVRPSVAVTFAYYPADGTVLLKSRHRARTKVLGLMQVFARSVLRAEIDEQSLGSRCLLDQLTQPFDPPLPEGVAMARVKTLDLAYPPSEGRRRLRLETNAADRQSAILELLGRHVDEETKAKLRVVAAELQVALRVRGRLKNYVIRLCPDRCSLSHSKTSELLRRCLKTWGLIRHAPGP